MLNQTDSQFARSVTIAMYTLMFLVGYGYAKLSQGALRTCEVYVEATSVESHVWLKPCREVE